MELGEQGGETGGQGTMKADEATTIKETNVRHLTMILAFVASVGCGPVEIGSSEQPSSYSISQPFMEGQIGPRAVSGTAELEMYEYDEFNYDDVRLLRTEDQTFGLLVFHFDRQLTSFKAGTYEFNGPDQPEMDAVVCSGSNQNSISYDARADQVVMEVIETGSSTIYAITTTTVNEYEEKPTAQVVNAIFELAL